MVIEYFCPLPVAVLLTVPIMKAVEGFFGQALDTRAAMRVTLIILSAMKAGAVHRVVASAMSVDLCAP